MIVDFHSHILPGCDHGSDGLECSLAQIKKAKEIGIDVIVSTSHYYQHSDTIDRFIEKREKCYNELKQALDKEKIDIKIYKAAEVTLEIGLPDDPDLSKLCIEGTNYMLLEMPMDEKWTSWVYNSVYEIGVKHHIRPIIAHIDRYEEKQVKKLLEMGVMAQVNATPLCHVLRRKRVFNYIKNEEAMFIGSDVHGITAPQYDDFSKALNIIGPRYTKALMNNACYVLGITGPKDDDTHEEGLIF